MVRPASAALFALATPASQPSAFLPDIPQIMRMKRNKVLRNRLITQRYHDLSQALAELTGRQNLNWFTFAVWASRTAGESIRKEVGRRELAWLEAAFNRAPGPLAFLAKRWLWPRLRGAFARALRAVSARVSAGNVKVFRDLAKNAADFIVMSRTHRRPEEGELGRFLRRFRKRRGPLAIAFESFYRAIFEKSPTRKARLMLLANGLIGLHEQTRLQPEIVKALETPIDQLVAPTLRKLMGPAWISRGLGLERIAVEPILASLKKVWRLAATRMMMNLSLPRGGRLRLAEDLPPGRDGSFLPRELRRIDAPSSLVRFLKRYDRVPGNTNRGTAARDWADLDDRMNFIVNLFQSRQQDQSLYAQPFSARLRASIERGPKR